MGLTMYCDSSIIINHDCDSCTIASTTYDTELLTYVHNVPQIHYIILKNTYIVQ